MLTGYIITTTTDNLQPTVKLQKKVHTNKTDTICSTGKHIEKQ